MTWNNLFYCTNNTLAPQQDGQVNFPFYDLPYH